MLINELTGSQIFLRPKGQALVTTRQAAGRPRHPRWTFTKLTPIPEPAAIPELKHAPDIYCPEGCTDFTFYARPMGTLKAVMLFVDFPDSPAGACAPADQANHLLGNGRAQQLFQDQSYGTFELTMDVLDHLGWRRLAQCSSDYNCHDFTSHRQYITDAIALFAGEINFQAISLC